MRTGCQLGLAPKRLQIAVIFWVGLPDGAKIRLSRGMVLGFN